MNIKALRNVHLYLGCFFAPLLLFFVISGCLQTFGLHRQMKNSSYRPPPVLQSLSEVHQWQRWGSTSTPAKPSLPFRWFMLAMSLGFIVTTILGILMAFQMGRASIAVILIGLGSLIPAILLWLAWMGS